MTVGGLPTPSFFAVYPTGFVVTDEAAGQPARTESLLTAADVAAYLNIAPRKVYGLPIPRVELSPRRVRWLQSDVVAYVRQHRRPA